MQFVVLTLIADMPMARGQKQAGKASATPTIVAGSAYAALAHAHEPMFGVAVAALVLLFSGIHNAWDAVTYHAFLNHGQKVNERPR